MGKLNDLISIVTIIVFLFHSQFVFGSTRFDKGSGPEQIRKYIELHNIYKELRELYWTSFEEELLINSSLGGRYPTSFEHEHEHINIEEIETVISPCWYKCTQN